MNNRLFRMGAVAVMALALIVATTACATKAPASKYPEKPIRVILTHAPGGTVDTTARMVAPFFEKYLGQTVVLENMPGAGGTKARAEVFRAAPDGYTLLGTTFPSAELGELVTGGAYETLKFSYFGPFTGKNYVVLTVPLNSPIKTFQELVERSKTKPVTMGTSGMGTSDHLAVIQFREKTGMQIINVPFDTGAAAETALLGGKIDCQVDNVKGAVPRLDRVRPLVIAADQRSELLPDVPTLGELGYPSFTLDSTFAFVGPPGVPEDVAKVLEAAVAKVVADPEFVAMAKKMGALPLALSGKDFKAMITAEYNLLKESVSAMKADIEGAGKK